MNANFISEINANKINYEITLNYSLFLYEFLITKDNEIR